MALITISKSDYDSIVWPVVAQRSPESADELAVADSLLVKLEAVGEQEAEEGQEVADAPFRMTLEQAEIEVTGAEAELLVKRLRNDFRRHHTQRLRSLLALVDSLTAASDEEKEEASLKARRVELSARAVKLEDELSALRAQIDTIDSRIATRIR